jgi:hypothetical protein
MEKINLSRAVKFQAGTLVKHKSNDLVGVVHNNSGVDSCWIKFLPNAKPQSYPESEVRELTFQEFAWYRDPSTGRMKIGRNNAFIILLSMAAAILSMVSSITVEGPWKLAPLLIGAGVIVINYVGLRYNYTRRWV